MKLYEITIQPMAGFGTALKGDTFFGHFCWQVARDPSLLNGGFEKHMAIYPEEPFIVFSSAFPKLVNSVTSYVLKRPDLPIFSLLSSEVKDRKERILEAKELKKRKWMLLEGELTIDLPRVKFLSDDELLMIVSKQATFQTKRQMRKVGLKKFITILTQPHNTINRSTQTTGTGQFAPYIQKIFHYYPETELVIFVLFNESVTDIERLLLAMERIGKWGFGKDASIGMGRFKLGKHKELPLPKRGNANACYVLSPSVPQINCFSEAYFKPFIRFGKHGDSLAHSGNPFKNPVIMADEGAVFMPLNESFFNKPYLGKGISGVSKSLPETMVQGYAPYLPIRVEK
ncbi:MAG: hypothetical protein ABIJ44_07285 [Pseudomonadota bacterium]